MLEAARTRLRSIAVVLAAALCTLAPVIRSCPAEPARALRAVPLCLFAFDAAPTACVDAVPTREAPSDACPMAHDSCPHARHAPSRGPGEGRRHCLFDPPAARAIGSRAPALHAPIAQALLAATVAAPPPPSRPRVFAREFDARPPTRSASAPPPARAPPAKDRA